MRIFLLVATLAVIYFALRILYQQNPHGFTKNFLKVGIGCLILLLIFLVVTGKLHWLFALVGALIPWASRIMRFAPLFGLFQSLRKNQAFGTAGASNRSAGQSEVQSRYLKMALNHEDGSMDGEVISGSMAGLGLSGMEIPELQRLYTECAADSDSSALLATYLEYRFGQNWQTHFDIHSGGGGEQGDSAAMTKQEASEILGVAESASKEEIVQAHRRLMQKFHPDRGGSDYLAAKINQAKETLLSS